jgi:hypothetical protein
MALLDFMVSRHFRNEKNGRVVVFPGDRRHRGYVVGSGGEELKIRSFLKMFYFAHLSILFLGYLLASEWATDLRHVLDRQTVHVLRAVGISLGIYFLVVGAPYFLLWRSYKKAFLNFVSPQDEVSVSGNSPDQKRQIFAAVAAASFAILLALGMIFLIRRR